MYSTLHKMIVSGNTGVQYHWLRLCIYFFIFNFFSNIHPILEMSPGSLFTSLVICPQTGPLVQYKYNSATH